MFKPISSAVSDSTMRAFSSLPPFSARGLFIFSFAFFFVVTPLRH
jgi:hypothetical protein